MKNLFLNAIKKYNLIQKDDVITVALSGGADSVSLLHILAQIKEEYNLTLYAAHLNHLIRGDEAFKDEEFCKDICKKLNVQLFIKRVNIPQLSKDNKIGEELCGRNERYKFFSELHNDLNCKIATAHTLSDNAETLIFNITRGCSVRGLNAIPPQRDYIIRPLIFCKREVIENYCDKNFLNYVTDSTNLCDDYNRNKIRHNVITTLKLINPDLENSIKRLCNDAFEINYYLNKQAQTELQNCKTKDGYYADKLLNLDSAIRKSAISIIFAENNVKNIEHIHIDLVEKILLSGGAVDLFGNFRAVVKQNIFRIVNLVDSLNDDNLCLELNLSEIINKKIIYNGFNYFIKEVNTGISDDIIAVPVEFLDKVVFRTRKQGDKFTFKKRNITKPLRKAMNEYKIPDEKRNKIPVLAIDNTVLWCDNIGVSQQIYSQNSNTEYIKIKIEKM